MKKALIDTDILSAFFRSNPVVTSHIEAYLNQHRHLNISIISYYEILNGLLYKDASNQLRKFEAFVALNNVVSLSMSAARLAADIYARLRRNGQPIGHTDTLIAAIAISNNFQLITNNTAHFSRIDGLDLGNWMISS